ncbi:MAG: CRISPR system precrRNA processing endoribonuclease RAMP protein Cas6 [Gammaproteobacteria bacterium]|nr:CRISPR system precrRNA processing endoribonuclease RAMP protein Cas6 [Gammaproteobacteria bacterium]
MTSPAVPLAQYRFTLRALEPICLPDYSGSAWRGVFGHALKDLACVTKQKTCSSCQLYRGCVYSYLFETPPPLGSEKMANGSAAPHPYILVPSDAKVLQVGETYALGLTLFGRANRHLDYVIYALNKAGERGIGRDHGRFELHTVAQKSADGSHQIIYKKGESVRSQPLFERDVPALPDAVTITLHTPLRLRSKGKNVRPEGFLFRQFFSSLLRRFSLLRYFHSDAPLRGDVVQLAALAHSVTLLEADLRWHEWRRYSSRQKNVIPMGGIVGSFCIKTSQLAPLWPYLWLGQQMHTGKGSSMGLGRYSLMLEAKK